MNVLRTLPFVTTAAVAAAVLAAPLQAQEPVAKLVAEPTSIQMKAGQTIPFRVRALDASGNVMQGAFVRVQAGSRSLRFSDTTVTATAAGKFSATAMAQGANGESVTLAIPVDRKSVV